MDKGMVHIHYGKDLGKTAFRVALGLTVGKYVGELVGAIVSGSTTGVIECLARHGNGAAKKACEIAGFEYEKKTD